MTAPAGEAAPSGAPTGSAPAAPESTYTAPQSQAEMDRIVEARLARQRNQYGMTPDELKTKLAELDAIKAEHASAADKVAQQAAEQAKAQALAELRPSLVAARLEAAAARAQVSEEALAKALKYTDTSKFLTSEGQLDTEAVSEFVGSISGSASTTSPPTAPRGPVLPGLNPGGAPTAKPGDGGRAAVERRFGKAPA